jgi:hypothetical protein
MAWTPPKKVIDLTPLAANLLAYIELNDADALAWANGGEALPEFAATYPNASGRLQTMFPSLMILAQSDAEDLSGEANIAAFNMTLEMTISGPDPDALVETAKRYSKAVKSMITNMPSGTFTADCAPGMTANLVEMEEAFDILRGGATPSAFLQIVQLRPGWSLIAPAF